jgi:hypothetical protein
MKNLEVYIDREDDLYSKLVNDNQYKIKIVDSDENAVTNSVFNLNLNTPYKNTHSGRVDPSLNGKNNTNFIVNSQINDISPGDLNSVKRITQLFNLNLNSCFRSNYYTCSSTDFSYIIPTEIKNVVSLRLASIEIPNTWYLFSNKQKNNTFQIIIDDECGTETYIIVIPDGNYDYESLQYYLNTTYFYESNLETKLKYIKFSIDSKNFKTRFELIDEALECNDFYYSLIFLENVNDNIMSTAGWLFGFRLPKYLNINGNCLLYNTTVLSALNISGYALLNTNLYFY